MARKKNDSNVLIEMPSMDIATARLTLVGDTPLIIHRFSEKAKRQILEKQTKKASTAGREAKNPVADFIDSLYWLSEKPEEPTEEAFAEAIRRNATFGLPSLAFKASAISAAYRAKVTKDMVSIRGAFHIDNEFVTIEGIPSMREDMVRIQGTSADIRYRGEFKEWKASFDIRYNRGVYSLEQIVTFFNLGGFASGVGEWRPEKGGNYGMFHVS